MSFLSRLFSAPGEMVKVTDAVLAAGDRLVFTPEEKSEAHQASMDWLLRFHEASSGSHLARRLLALMVTALFIALVVAAGVLVVVGSAAAPPMIGLIGAAHLPELVGGVWVFYFGHSLFTKR